ncbi:MAG: DNA primase [Nocardioides sp.]|uniref:DNA primase n=1 Tax=Nocardioides sp. TaxID=35761 RepID=UPI003F10BB1D
MLGRIRDDDIAEVREKARIDDVVGSYVTLRRAGGGSLKGLCPFHDEKSPSFHVTPARQMFHCFGCQEGGDVIAFLMKIDGLTFIESVERLAEKYGVQLRREGGDDKPERPRGPARGRLLEGHKIAQQFYAEQLLTPEAAKARQFLEERGFDHAAAELFGVGFAPSGGEALYRHLKGRRFTDEEVVAAGLVAQGRSMYDRFRGRLLWPIREASGETIGFGARRIFDDDRIEAKYLNTPETPIYKKSQVLYGIDLARREIGSSGQAVVVEGYTDVMACHLAGVKTAVATCGTAFGEDHARVLRRFVKDDQSGEVIFTFDGDAAGQKAAMRVFENDHMFTSPTYVAVAPDGLDPCDLRLQQGDEAVRELVSTRRPLYQFAMENVLARYDLDRADSRVDALRAAAQMVSSVRDSSKVDAFTREIAQMIGVDVEQARAEVRKAASRPAEKKPQHTERRAVPPAGPAVPGQQDGPPAAPRRPMPRLDDPRYAIERELLKVVLQDPTTVGRTTTYVTVDDFTHPVCRALWAAVMAAGGVESGAGDPGWANRVLASATEPLVQRTVTALGVEPVRLASELTVQYVLALVHKLQELTATRRIDDVKSRLQRTNQATQADEYTKLFSQLVVLEQHRRTLRDRLAGEQ